MTYNFHYFYSPICLLWLLFVGSSSLTAETLPQPDDDNTPAIVSAGILDKTDDDNTPVIITTDTANKTTGDSSPTPITAGISDKTDTGNTPESGSQPDVINTSDKTNTSDAPDVVITYTPVNPDVISIPTVIPAHSSRKPDTEIFPSP